jgi:hypothetical protein
MSSIIWTPNQPITPQELKAARPSRKAQMAAKAGSRPPVGGRPPAAQMVQLPMPGLKVAWNNEHVALVLCFGEKELPLPYEDAEALKIAAALVVAVREFRKAKLADAAAAEKPLPPELQELLDEAIENTAGPVPAEAVADSPDV